MCPSIVHSCVIWTVINARSKSVEMMEMVRVSQKSITNWTSESSSSMEAVSGGLVNGRRIAGYLARWKHSRARMQDNGKCSGITRKDRFGSTAPYSLCLETVTIKSFVELFAIVYLDSFRETRVRSLEPEILWISWVRRWIINIRMFHILSKIISSTEVINYLCQSLEMVAERLLAMKCFLLYVTVLDLYFLHVL